MAACIIVAAFACVFYGAFLLERSVCVQKWSDFETEFRLPGGCMVKIDGRFVPQGNVRF